MAKSKSKHSTALFEVIKGSRGLDRPGKSAGKKAGGWATWFGNRKAAPVIAEVESTPSAADRTPTERAAERPAGDRVPAARGEDVAESALPPASPSRSTASAEKCRDRRADAAAAEAEERPVIVDVQRAGTAYTPPPPTYYPPPASAYPASAAAARADNTDDNNGDEGTAFEDAADDFEPRPAKAGRASSHGSSLPPRAENLAVSVDSDRRQIALRMSYTTAIVGGFSVVMIVLMAVLIGRQMTKGPQTAMGGTPLADLKLKAPTPDVMKPLKPGTGNGGTAVPASASLGGASAHPTVRPAATGTATGRPTGSGVGQVRSAPGSSAGTSPGMSPPPPPFNEPRLPATFVDDSHQRQIGLNYVVIQSYASTEPKLAEDTRDFLRKNNIPCTVEENVKGWDSRLAVVGLRGFSGTASSPQYGEYVSTINKLSTQYAANKNSYKAFQPMPKKWDKAN